MEIGPQLKAVHAAGGVALGHFLVDDAAAGGHPLDVAGGDGAPVSEAVAVLDRSCQDVRDCLDTAVRVPGKAREIVFRDVIAKIVEQQEGIELGRVAKAKCAAEVHAGAFGRRFTADVAASRVEWTWLPPKLTCNFAVYAAAPVLSSGSGWNRRSRSEKAGESQSIWRARTALTGFVARSPTRARKRFM